jgi:pentatricopeptide repeat protein
METRSVRRWAACESCCLLKAMQYSFNIVVSCCVEYDIMDETVELLSVMHSGVDVCI